MLKNSVGYQYHYKTKYYNWANMYKAGSLEDMPFLGYKVEIDIESESYDRYNNSPTTRDINRLLFLDEAISQNAIEVYLNKIQSTNLLIQRRKEDTVFAKDVQERIYDFEKGNIKIPEYATEGEYHVIIQAVDEMGNVGMAIVF